MRHHEPSTGSYLSNLQARPPLFGDNNNTTADDWSQDRNHPDSATAAPAVPTHGDNRSNDRSDLVGSNGAGEQRTRRGSPRLLRHLLLTRQPQPPPQPQPQSTSTVTPSCQPNRSHCDERAAGTVRDDEWRSCLGDMDIVLSSTPSRRSRAGDLAEACRTRMGGEAKRGAEERGSSTASIGSVGSELRGGELERVRGRVADLSAAIETSQVRNSRFRYRDFFIPLMTFFFVLSWNHPTPIPVSIKNERRNRTRLIPSRDATRRHTPSFPNTSRPSFCESYPKCRKIFSPALATRLRLDPLISVTEVAQLLAPNRSLVVVSAGGFLSLAIALPSANVIWGRAREKGQV